jgi:hypothetical protein
MTKEGEPPAIRSRYRFTIHPAEGIHRPVINIFTRTSGTIAYILDEVLADLRAQGVDVESHAVLYEDDAGDFWYEVDVGADGWFDALRPMDVDSEEAAIASLRARWQLEWDAMAADAKRLEAGR